MTHIPGIYKCYECMWGTDIHRKYYLHIKKKKHELYSAESDLAVHANKKEEELGEKIFFGKGLSWDRCEERRELGLQSLTKTERRRFGK